MRFLIATAFEHSKDPFENLALDYIKRTQPLYRPELKQVKADKLLPVTERSVRVVFDETGILQDSVQFARQLQKFLEQARPVAFLIGPPEGHNPQVRSAADKLWSLSKLTLPHKMALCVLAEQIYRSGEILRNGPYHK
ncbi:MAG: 23S rRNA (pseudouridine(1915)-N(3))-methyltransferase RlmH [Myxococcaceae bacterium]|nr:23S rRNA (pseudouridine(1915)-N(3))-methyltransferase RlmH [Myxococcaceae bacterium]MBH2006752.1 23S rRNA (pseudouridine(1915)-N(3))-methyltransferase RlmH [Myxococcaceae bacterium]